MGPMGIGRAAVVLVRHLKGLGFKGSKVRGHEVLGLRTPAKAG